MGFKFNPFTGKFDQVGAGGGGGGSAGDVIVDTITLDAGMVAAKAVTLTDTPAVAAYTLLQLVRGGVQQFTADFTVSGTTLSWNGLGMDAIPMEVGDVLVVAYQI